MFKQRDEIALYVELYSEGDYDENLIFSSDLGYFGTAVFWEYDTGNTNVNSFMNLSLQSETPSSLAKSKLVFETGGRHYKSYNRKKYKIKK